MSPYPDPAGIVGQTPGLPSGLRTDGYYYQPHIWSAATGTAGVESDGGIRGGRLEDACGEVLVVKGAGGDGDRVYYAVGRGIMKAPTVEPHSRSAQLSAHRSAGLFGGTSSVT
jgi:hypothetical protein